MSEDDDVTSRVTAPQTSSRGSELHIRHFPSLQNPTTGTNRPTHVLNLNKEANLPHHLCFSKNNSFMAINQTISNFLKLQ